MAYTQKRFTNDESEFPTPPLWLLWYSDVKHAQGVRNPDGSYHRESKGTLDQGQIRHHPTLQKCKKGVYLGGPAGRKVFWNDWAIYEWTGERYEKRYEGFQGETNTHNPLFSKGVARDGTHNPSREVLDEELEEALASIRSAIR